jgi:aminopeptidase N
MTTQRAFRYYRTDFGPMPVTLVHMDVDLNIIDGRVEGRNRLRLRALEPLATVRLDARDIDIRSVCWLGASGASTPVSYHLDAAQNALHVTLPEPVPAGREFTLETRAVCVPTDNILEGIYKDSTPPGCPQQYMSQCQQWGFQRILPVIDDCRAKCTFTTTLEADARYTHLISNGNINRERNPEGRPVLKAGAPTRQVITYDVTAPMAPYLFLVAAGTWDELADEVVYPSGRRLRLEYLVPPGRRGGAVIPMQILKRSVLWQARTQDYECPHEVYRTICMEKSNFGGMENTGNTTIITEAALIDAFTGDGRLQYAHGVIVHEFEHNQCGSDVTMETPFDMWLNEAYTVDVEREFMHSEFDPACGRLDEIEQIRAPIGGPLAIEDAGHQGQIVREAFNDPDELVDGVTYVKAAEVIRMLKAMLGPDVFRAARNAYFRAFTGSNANTDQFFECFERVSGRDLRLFRREWLHTIGYPCLEAEHRYDPAARALTLNLRQTRSGAGGLFHFPLEVAAVDDEGRDLPGSRRTIEVAGAETSVTFADLPRPAFVSINRGMTFYGTCRDVSATRDMLFKQARLDPDEVNRVEAMRRLTDEERLRLLRDPAAAPQPEWIQTWAAFLTDPRLRPGLKAYLLRVDEASLDRACLPLYRERYAVRRRLMGALAGALWSGLLAEFDSVDTFAKSDDPKQGFEERRLKAVLLQVIAAADRPEAWRVLEQHFARAWHMSDRAAALECLMHSDSPARLAVLQEALDLWKDHLNGYTTWLRAIGGGKHDEVFELIAREEREPRFRREHPTHTRALYLPLAANNRLLWTRRGLEWMRRTVLAQAAVNENTALRLVSALQMARKLPDDLGPEVLKVLRDIRAGVDARAYPSLAGRVDAFLGVEDKT